jgi:PEGA domain
MMLRLNLFVFVVLVLARTAAAQHAPSNPTGTIPPLRGPLPTGTIPVLRSPLPARPIQLPRLGLPLPSIGLPPAGVRWNASVHRVRDRGFVSPVIGGGLWWPNVVYVMPDTFPFAPDPYVAAAPFVEPTRAAPPTGSLVLDVYPGSAEVRVDGYYFGTVADLSAQRDELALEPGPHRVRIEAPGYEPVSLDVRIVADASISYRKDLIPTPESTPKSTSAPAPAKPKTFYMIPGCYLGDVPPKDAALPPTCDPRRTVTFTP